MRKLILDCDPGVDDATALMLAFAARTELDLLGVTAVAGNVPLEKTVRNACAIREIAGREDVPVFAGCAQPLMLRPEKAEDFHGAGGLGTLKTPDPKLDPDPRNAVIFIVDTLLRAAPRSVTMAITGPCTNLAAALAIAPKIAEALAEVVIMGGARSEGGNITASAEYNIYADPHAAAAVVAAPFKKTFFGLDATHQVRHTAAHIAAMRAIGTPAALTVAELFEFSNGTEMRWNAIPHAPLHDPCTIAYLLQRDLFSFRDCRIAVETQGALTMGHTQVEFRENYKGPFNAQWAVAADGEGVLDLIRKRIATL
jgi:purine nucleosidase